MNTLHPNIVFLAGLVIIILGAEILLRGASRIAVILGVRPIIIGLTIVSIGTSAPELAVGIAAVTEGRGQLAVGNIAGTNLLNILFILGLSAWIHPLPLRQASIRFEVPLMIATALGLIAMAWNGVISQVEGIVLILAAVAYTAALIRMSREEGPRIKREYAEEFSAEAVLPKATNRLTDLSAWRVPWSITLFLVGLALTLFGADLLVKGAAAIASSYGVSDAVIGLTIVAIGTSAPELATTLLATIKKDRDVAIGNLIGSSIYNVLVILGITCAVSPTGAEVGQGILRFDLPLGAAVAVVCYPVFKSGRVVSRREGAAFVIAYVCYLISLLLFRT